MLLRLFVTLTMGAIVHKCKHFLNPRSAESTTGPTKLRLTLERLGGTFVKFGQLFAMRPDLLSTAYTTELSKLLDNVAPFDGLVAARIIQQELGKPISEIFDHFALQSTAAASFAQVHRARLSSGQEVAVKVQRPGLERIVRADLAYLRLVSRIIDYSGLMKRVHLRPFVDDFIRWTSDELNFLNEGAYAERMRRSSIRISSEYIPVIHWKYSSRRVLTTEFLNGTWISDLLLTIDHDHDRLNRLEAEGLDLKEIARNLFFNTVEQALERATFHADPHAGNLVVLTGNIIGYVDFGITGQLDAELRSIQLSIFQALADEDFDQYFRSILRFFYPLPEIIDYQALKEEIVEGARKWSNAFFNPNSALGERGTAPLLTSALLAARRFGLSFSLVALRYYRAVIAVEMIVLRLDPCFDFRKAMRRFVYQLQIRTIRRGDTPANLFRTWVKLQLWRQNLPAFATRLALQAEYDRETIWANVSDFKMLLSSTFRALAIMGILGLLAAAVVRLGFPHVFKRELGQGWFFLPLLALLVALSAWFSRRLYITAVRR